MFTDKYAEQHMELAQKQQMEMEELRTKHRLEAEELTKNQKLELSTKTRKVLRNVQWEADTIEQLTKGIINVTFL